MKTFRSRRLLGFGHERLAPWLLVILLTAYATMEGSAAPGPFALLHSLFDPSNNAPPATNHYFGIAVSVSGSRVVVGAYQDDTGTNTTGSAYVYELASPTPVATLTNPSPAFLDRFGYAVSISGSRVVIGAPGDNTGASDAGSAYVYDLTSATPTVPVITLTNSSPAGGDSFGFSVAISGTRVVVGAPFDNAVAGSAYVYDLNSAAPRVPVATLTNPSPEFFDLFGQTVAISDTRVVVGAPADNAGDSDAGSAYVYDLNSAAPTVPVATLADPSPAPGDNFGISVAISGRRIVVGAYRDDAGTSEAGSAYVYDLASATPLLPWLTLTNSSPAGGALFGSSVAISGTQIVVGAPSDSALREDPGSAYVYDLASANPTVPVTTLTNPSPAFDDLFGQAVAIAGETIVVGAPRDDTHAENRGAAYVFDSRPALTIVPASPGLATLSWTPTMASGFVLQYTDSFAPTNWFNAPSGATNPVTLTATNLSRFYRLCRP